MTNQVYPTLAGLEFNVHRTPMWEVDIRTTPSQREYRSTDQVYPRRRRVLSYEFLRSAAAFAELQTLEGFFNLHHGPAESFFFSDPDDNVVSTQQVIGVGNGTTTDFQLARVWGGVVEPIAARAAPTAQIFKDGVLQSSGFSFILGDVYPLNTNKIRFTTAPAAGVQISWTGGFYWRCRFNRKDMDFVKFLDDLWKTGTVDLIDTRT